MKSGFIFTIVFLLLVGCTSTAQASILSGIIDPQDSGSHYIQFLNSVDVGNGSAEKSINFGKFINQPASNITIDDAGLRGYAWGGVAGWIVMNCLNTTSGCSSTNGNFKVDFARDGILKGYAWGENTGWINFGPFTNTAISRVQISSEGRFGGTSGNAGYAWSEQYGWIVFDCSATATCVTTDYRPPASRAQCSNLIDDDGDGAIDLAEDRGCTNIYDNTETYSTTGSTTQCADNIDNDNDGRIDFADPHCGGGSTSEFGPTVAVPPVIVPPAIPGTVTPVPPTTPTTPVKPTPNRPQPRPTAPPSEPGQSEPSAPSEPVSPSEPVVIPVITPVINTVTDIVTGEVGVPEARDRVIEFFRTVVVWVREVFDSMNRALVSFMADETVQNAVAIATVLGLFAITAPLVPLFALAPIAALKELALFPSLLWHSVMSALGLVPVVKPWGVVYDSTTHQPIALGHVSLINEYGAIAATATTQSDGSFSAKVPNGSYTLRVDTGGSTLPFASGAPLIFTTMYDGAQSILIRNNQPAIPLDVAVLGGSGEKPHVSSIKEFMLSHEVTLTNISFVLFGIGTLASVLYLIFFPSLTSFVMASVYVGIAVLRGIGMFGSYASVFLDKVGGLPLAGKLVTVFDARTNIPVSKTLTSALGRAHLALPDGYYYGVISDPSPLGDASTTVMTKPFAARAGLFRKRFLL